MPMRVHLIGAHLARLCCTHAYAQPCPSTNGTLALTRRSPNDVYSSGGVVIVCGIASQKRGHRWAIRTPYRLRQRLLWRRRRGRLRVPRVVLGDFT